MYILLCCAAGMSTSMVVRKMQEEAKKQGKNYKIKAVDSELVKLEIKEADVVLIPCTSEIFISSCRVSCKLIQHTSCNYRPTRLWHV